MALTLLEAAIQQRADPLQGAFVQMFDEYSPIFNLLPMTKIDGRFYDYERVVTLPTQAWRPVNGTITESTGVVNPFREYLKILSGQAEVDMALVRTSPRKANELMERQIKLHTQAAMNEFTRAFFEGSELNSAHEMVGLRPRLSGTQLILQASGGGTLTLAKLNDLIDAVPFSTRQETGMKRGEGLRKVLFMNRTLRRKITTLIEATSGAQHIMVEKDNFGRYVERYRDADIVVVEQTGTGTTTLDFDEDPGDGASDTASIYAVAMGEDLVHGIHNNSGNNILAIDRYEKPLEERPRFMTRFEGYFGMAIDHPKAAARLYGITNS